MPKLRELLKEKSELEMTPMIDVTFLLLVFFLCTLRFKTLEGKLSAYLPKDVGSAPRASEPLEKVEVVIRVLEPGARLVPGSSLPREDGDPGRFVFGNDRRVEYGVATFATTDAAALAERLRSIRGQRLAARPLAPVPVSIDARAGTIASDVTRALDAVLEAGFTDVTFVAARDERTR